MLGIGIVLVHWANVVGRTLAPCFISVLAQRYTATFPQWML